MSNGGWEERHKQGLVAHIRRAQSLKLPGNYLRFGVGADRVGYVAPDHRADLRRLGCVEADDGSLIWPDPSSLPDLGRALAAAGLVRWRGEDFDVRRDRDGMGIGPVIAKIDRSALALLGISACGVHLNGLVRRGDQLFLWVAQRSPHKIADPGLYDHLVAGGIGHGLSPAQTLIKEAAEEAGMPADLTAQAQLQSALHYAIARPEGVRRDVLYCYDLYLPDDFTPRIVDQEVERFELWTIDRAIDAVVAGDVFKFNVNLVLIDLWARLALIDAPAGLRDMVIAPPELGR